MFGDPRYEDHICSLEVENAQLKAEIVKLQEQINTLYLDHVEMMAFVGF